MSLHIKVAAWAFSRTELHFETSSGFPWFQTDQFCQPFRHTWTRLHTYPKPVGEFGPISNDIWINHLPNPEYSLPNLEINQTTMNYESHLIPPDQLSILRCWELYQLIYRCRYIGFINGSNKRRRKKKRLYDHEYCIYVTIMDSILAFSLWSARYDLSPKSRWIVSDCLYH